MLKLMGSFIKMLEIDFNLGPAVATASIVR